MLGFEYNLVMANWVGKRLGKVQIESLVARGGVAEIYVGTHTTLDRKVAVKILRNLSEDNSDALLRFQREARVIAKLRHPNIVQVHDFDTVDSDPYLVMEYIEGPSLSKYLNTLHKKNGRLDYPQVIRLMNAIASALQYAHKNSVIHRDIKPGNILLTSAYGSDPGRSNNSTGFRTSHDRLRPSSLPGCQSPDDYRADCWHAGLYQS